MSFNSSIRLTLIRLRSSKILIVPILAAAMAICVNCTYADNDNFNISPQEAIKNTSNSFNFSLRDGSIIVGKFSEDTLRLRSISLGNLDLSVSDIGTIEWNTNSRIAVLTATNDEVVEVKFPGQYIQTETSFGKIKLPVELITSIKSSLWVTPTQTLLTNDLLSFWNFGGTNPNSYVPDGGSLSYPLQTGDDGRGQVNPGVVVPGLIGNAIGFGTNGNQGLYIPSGDFPILTTFTITAWVKLNYNTNNYNHSLIACSWDGSSLFNETLGWNFFMQIYNGTLEGTVAIGGTTWQTVTSSSQVNFYDEQWHFCVFQCSDANYIQVKVDNGSWTTLSISGSIAGASSRPFQVGQDLAQAIYNADCNIDMLGVWDRILTDEEISELYNNGQGLEYPF